MAPAVWPWASRCETNGDDPSGLSERWSIYPLLNRLKRAALVKTTIEESPGGPARKYYELTNNGREQTQWMNQYWRRLQRGVDSLASLDEGREDRRSGSAKELGDKVPAQETVSREVSE